MTKKTSPAGRCLHQLTTKLNIEQLQINLGFPTLLTTIKKQVTGIAIGNVSHHHLRLVIDGSMIDNRYIIDN